MRPRSKRRSGLLLGGGLLALAACQAPSGHPVPFEAPLPVDAGPPREQAAAPEAVLPIDSWLFVVTPPDASIPADAPPACSSMRGAWEAGAANDAGTTVTFKLDGTLSAAILAPVPSAGRPFVDAITPKCAGIWYDEETLAGPYEARLYFGFSGLPGRPIKRATLELPGLSLVNAAGRPNRLYLETVDAANINAPGANAMTLFALRATGSAPGSSYATLPPAAVDVTALVARSCGSSIQFRMRWDRSANPAMVDIYNPPTSPINVGVCPSSALYFTLTVTY